jgi:DNA-binding XRE family transcriptional regulator
MKPNNEERLRIGLLISDRRKKLKITQEKLAELAKVNRTSINKIEQGKFGATVDLISAIAAPLGLEIDLKDK